MAASEGCVAGLREFWGEAAELELGPQAATGCLLPPTIVGRAWFEGSGRAARTSWMGLATVVPELGSPLNIRAVGCAVSASTIKDPESPASPKVELSMTTWLL